MANIAIPRMAVAYRALLSCVARAGKGLSGHGLGVEPLFCLDFCDHNRAQRLLQAHRGWWALTRSFVTRCQTIL